MTGKRHDQQNERDEQERDEARMPSASGSDAPEQHEHGAGESSGAGHDEHAPRGRLGRRSRNSRTIRTSPPPYRWECPCQDPPVLLATYDPSGRINIKVRDRYWHLYGFGQMQAICPRCAAEHLLDLRQLGRALEQRDEHEQAQSAD